MESAPVRLTSEQTEIIKKCIAQSFGERSRTWLFGSRADDSRRGGDVDLYVEPEYADLRAEMLCRATLKDMLDLDVDLIVKRAPAARTIERIARETGISL